ncbi:pyridoxamine 5'-phosphate oxidase family protein [Kaistia dalseonensis]|uniref:General stress protein 26 n=1 Tax=Kaistia dalseonensis TaxID=410840 RepID=A0ABU0HA28_9HYPH|nr:pyridoxamine 5'-phosphate oxidase family protein [Kaistia dalseonensis]MCX5496557.1 pyridoxamine 5'-phosphate oxidase family protein [Kaistia dalseonensis]MDQ0439179.1 general stress protein 26 [Kaistia dalseonensis]
MTDDKKITTDTEARDKVFELVADAHIAMMASLGGDGHWHSRPMATGKEPFGGDLWFLTDIRSEKIDDLEKNPEVLLSYADEDHHSYVSITGTAAIVRDSDMVDELWSEPARIWFPDGPTDPNIALIRVSPESAEYWDSPSSAMVTLLGYAKVLTTGKPLRDIGENRKVDFN